jgi:hypothetical protein
MNEKPRTSYLNYRAESYQGKKLTEVSDKMAKSYRYIANCRAALASGGRMEDVVKEMKLNRCIENDTGQNGLVKYVQ